MRIAEIVGKVTLGRVHPTLQGAQLKLAVPLTLEHLRGEKDPLDDEFLVVYDPFSTGVGEQIALSEGGEAAQPFYPELKPVDAYNAAILDSVHLRDQ
ncbi:carbon dioxide concentrating mechanism protein CcmL [Blastopirellula sp. JC732]|uniref:Carbon dioxide concentrating mechanism protein CcmL n=1 Tax=Blastopirellula sediminis TaxID=2894196 RepID=A0A9X1MLA1_9BACT|nr:EutN/CcmL family microcompartment protein [Blastopirellula sediminis]MCC9609241.1 carbon dioxide concentrating mechanism protein CcmL [Blastopirellula sediminis]MCC9627982.1 carbon dioxide concentrating mechanism protein CcmL [Blastopirellula sediminis]